MNLREEIIKNTSDMNFDDFETNLFLTNLAKGFVKDYKIYKEDTASLYTDIFGEEYNIIFEEFNDNIEILKEELKEDKTLLFEEKPTSQNLASALLNKTPADKGKEALVGFTNNAKNTIDKAIPQAKEVVGKVGEEIKNNVNNITGQKAKTLGSKIAGTATTALLVGRNLLGAAWEKIKEVGANLAKKFPKVGEFLSKGVTWISQNPAIVAGAAGGVVLLGLLARALKKRGDIKKAEKLQAAINEQKKIQNLEAQKA